MGSRPAFSASVRGMTSTASANASTASCSRPPTLVAYLRSSFAISISIAPPPGTILLFSITSDTTESESIMARSASSTMRSKPARIRIATLCGSLHFSTKIILSSPILRSSTCPANPRSAFLRSSRSLTIRAACCSCKFLHVGFFDASCCHYAFFG